MKTKVRGSTTMSISVDGLGLQVPESIDLFDRFGDDFDRFDFPGPLCRVTGGHGGESILIVGSDKTALIDCGMAYCGPVTVSNTGKVLDSLGRKLDYILLSHSHYDHIGALPFFREAFPDAEVIGSSHCRNVLVRESARKLIRELGEAAKDQYDPGSDLEIPVEGLEVDRVVEDGERLSLGKENGEDLTVEILHTPGHTDCSISFFLEPYRLLITSESTGIFEGMDYVHTPCLKSFMASLDSADRCESREPAGICLPHFGMMPEETTDKYWDMFRDECRSKTEFVWEMSSEGLTEDEMLEKYLDRYWTPLKQMEQPREAFEINSRHILKSLIRELDQLRDRWN